MADTNFRGPVNSMGSLEVQAGNTATVEPFDGPSISYQGHVTPDIRFGFAKDGMSPARQPSFMTGQSMWAVDQIPQAATTTALGTTQVATAGTAMSLATTGVSGNSTSAWIAVGVPIIPVGTTRVTTAIALDFGFTVGSTVANSTTVDCLDNTVMHTGQWLVIGNVGNSAKTLSHIAQVQTILSNGTGITVSPAPLATLTTVPIGQGNLWGSGLLPPGTQFGPSTASASAHSFAGGFTNGLSRTYNPREMLARTITLATQTTVAFTAVVTGYDLWGNLMTEMVTVPATAGATTVAGKKAFKYVLSVVPGTGNGTCLVSVGLGESFGFPVRSDEWEQTRVTWNKSLMTNANGYTAATLTNPATNTTGDVRGSVQVSTAVAAGAISTAISAVATNGTSRLTIVQYPGVWNQAYGTPTNTVPMFGPAQSTA